MRVTADILRVIVMAEAGIYGAQCAFYLIFTSSKAARWVLASIVLISLSAIIGALQRFHQPLNASLPFTVAGFTCGIYGLRLWISERGTGPGIRLKEAGSEGKQAQVAPEEEVRRTEGDWPEPQS